MSVYCVLKTRIAVVPRNVKLLASLEADPPTTTIEPPVKTQLVRRKYRTFLWRNNLDEYDINYRVEVAIDGPPILLVHGFGANVNHFRFQFPALKETDFRVYAVDLLGFGASDKPKVPITALHCLSNSCLISS
jgi:hypothetical protein